MIPHHDSLPAELREVEHQHPGWHAFVSDEGRAYAVRNTEHSGITVYAPTPELLDHEIAVLEYAPEGRAARWAA